jgi:hypothetical protein
MRLLDRARLDDDVVEVPALGVMRKAAVGGPVAQEAMVSSKRSAASSMGTQKPENSLCDNPCPHRSRGGRRRADRAWQPARRAAPDCARTAPPPPCQAYALRPSGKVAQVIERGRELPEARDVMLDHEHAVIAKLLGQQHIVDVPRLSPTEPSPADLAPPNNPNFMCSAPAALEV